MDLYPILFTFSITIFYLSSSSAVLSTLSASQQIQDGNTIVSDGKIYELGFFSPGKSKNRYLGIWYNKISPITVVWVANRETPISDKSGVFEVGRDGNLVIHSRSNTIIWSSNSTPSVNSINPVAQLLDSGNLILWDEKSTKENPIWQSFDYPGNTLLPGMKFGKDLVTGIERSITSWKSPDDPSKGLYKYYVDTNGYPQVFRTEGLVVQFRLAPWNGVGFRGEPIENENQIYSVEFLFNDKEIYYRSKLKSSVLQTVTVMPDGFQVQSNWINRTQKWVVYGNSVVDSCSLYGLCGPYGRCSLDTYPPCNCLDGFQPRIPEEWHAGDWSSGCQRKTPLDCSNNQDSFQVISGVKFPDTRRAWYNVSMSLGECKMACRTNCSCTAYANLDIRIGGSGCLLWFDELMDMRDYNDHQEIYIKAATSELAGKSKFYNNGAVVLISFGMSVSSAILLLTAVTYCRKKKKKAHQKSQGNGAHTLEKDKTSDRLENLDDQVPFFSLHKIAKATRNFNIDNKIGEGGFGPVYKGILGDGQMIAVKRLSVTSEQGLDEFRNEVLCIAKLQHRNLVKLLGYCIHGKEKILIYQYMDNKSLDSFLFDETRSSMLDWTQRFRIMHGIARGILYLHQDSRLQIIHRDVKASNILLDNEMNPKISDFGLARFFVGQDAMATTIKVVGTYGYISPEYAVHGHFSTKSDVFSFGVLMLEIVSGKKNRGFSHEGQSDNLLEHAWKLYMEDKSIELMNASSCNSYVFSEVQRSIHIGLLCVQHYAEDRPNMLSVVLMLSSECALPPPKEPTFFTQENFH